MGDVDQLGSGEGAEGQGHDQIGHAERVEPQGGAAAGALGEPAGDQRRGDTGSDVAGVRGEREQRGQMAEAMVSRKAVPRPLRTSAEASGGSPCPAP
jgi:hypothetical protein